MKTTFYYDYCFEGGGEDSYPNLSGRYSFWMNLDETQVKELGVVYDNNDGFVDNWGTDWTGHEDLFNLIEETAIRLFNSIDDQWLNRLKPFGEVYWELFSKEMFPEI